MPHDLPTLRFGLFGGPARRGAAATDADGYRAYVEGVLEAERLGFFGTYLVEHHFTGHGQVSASLNLLTYVAALTSTIRLGTAVVVVPWHNPVLLAEQAATLDLLSGGRLDLGLGRGYRDYEFTGFGVPRSQAGDRFDEMLTFLREAWASASRFSFAGNHWKFTDIVIEPKPLQSPHPPIWVGAASASSIEAAAARGLKLFLDQVATRAEIAERVRIYREAQSEAGIPHHPNDIALTRPLLLAKDAKERDSLFESHLATLGTLSDSTSHAADNPFYSNPRTRRERTEDGAILGDAAECIDRLAAFRELGIHQVLFTRTTPQSLRTFSETVMAAFS